MTLPNPLARRLFLHLHALAEPPIGPARGDALQALIDRLGFVQLDSIATVARAHHMILFARRQSYRQDGLDPLLARRGLFEHWTHDAAVIPTRFFPFWRHRFRRDRPRLLARWRGWQRDGFEDQFETVLARIAERGPVSASDVGEDETRGTGGWWDWHPSKAALEYLWRVGELSITRRDAFRKVYDLTSRVIPEEILAQDPGDAATIDWACSAALARLGFATSGELAAFWAAATPAEAQAWCHDALAQGRIVEVRIEGADGTLRRSYARPDLVEQAQAAPEPPSRIRILSPFDPALRDRNRAERLFGFRYRIEIYVPEPKRTFGYYVFPILEGGRLIGRIDMKARRDRGTLQVRALWPEPGIRLGAGRLGRLEAELDRMARFAGCERVAFDPGWQRDPV
ncbi:winged helix-turn-helix domain-containing protein [Rhodobacter sp. CZR27]|uniref:winged helix-turn-helix domain-containing protein n=1 Tax=Rhodobacter sp. CZR27 TaxID=2033869 RepID=UPI000BBE98A7|nr:crosslink repair DNA glycosylase YcaQ family protein [Rhodobacter sp. CZR27]